MLQFSGDNGGMPTMGDMMGNTAGAGSQPMGQPIGQPAGKRPAPISLAKGQRISLSKVAPAMHHVLVGLGWTIQRYSGAKDFDLDASAFLVNANGRTDPNDFVFYGALNQMPDGRKCDAHKCVIHSGDNKVGGDGNNDDEQITIDLDAVPDYIQKIAISCTIFDADVRHQNFGMVENAFIRLVDSDTGNEVARYNMGEDFSTETAVVVAELYRHNGEWKFNAVGSGYAGGLANICAQYGIETTN